MWKECLHPSYKSLKWALMENVVSQWNLLSSMWGAPLLHLWGRCSFCPELLCWLTAFAQKRARMILFCKLLCDFQTDLSTFLCSSLLKWICKTSLEIILEVTRYVWDRRLMQVWNKWYLTQKNRKRPLVQRAIISVLDSPKQKIGFLLLFWTGTGAPSQLTYFFQRRSHLPGTVVDICGWKLYTDSDNVHLYL